MLLAGAQAAAPAVALCGHPQPAARQGALHASRGVSARSGQHARTAARAMRGKRTQQVGGGGGRERQGGVPPALLLGASEAAQPFILLCCCTPLEC